MTTNKPGTVTQQPLHGCTSCYEDYTYPAVDLRVYDNECWCEECWDNASYEVSDGIDWADLAPFKPALQAEHEKLVSYTQNGIECFANPCPDHSGVNAPPFSEFQERYGRLCLMCVVDERDALQVECENLRKDAERYRWLCDGNGYFLEHEMLCGSGNEKAQADAAIDATMQGEPVSAQVRYRRPEKGQPGWSVWQPAAVMLDRPSWEIDSQGWEVEYRLLYTAPQPKPDVTHLVEALERIMTWPDGGNRYGQANIKVFAAEALAAHYKQQEGDV